MFFADGITHLDSPVESFESLPDCLDSGEWLALRWVGADEASAVDDEGSDVGWHSGGHVEDFTVALEGQQGEQEPDVPFGLDIGRRGLWTFPRAHGDVGDMAGGDGVEGEAFAQVVGGVESAVRDAGAGLEGFEPCLHGPPFPVPVQHGGGVDGVGFPLCRACGREQQPVQRLRAVGGVGLGGGDGAHRQRFRALPLLLRRQERDLRDPDFQAGGARLSGPRASGGRDDQFRHRDGGPGRGVRPQAPLPPVRCLHPPLRRPAGAHQQRVAACRRAGEDANAAPAATAEFHQALRRFQAGVVERCRVLYGQHDGLGAAAVGGRRDVRLQNVIHGHPRVR